MKKKARKKRKSGQQADREPWLQLDAIRGPEADAFYRQAQDEEFAKYSAWVDAHCNAKGTELTSATEEECRAQYEAARERVYMRLGYRFIHMLPPVQQQRLRETYPDPPAEYLAQPPEAAREQRAV